MADFKEIRTRIALKQLTYAEWDAIKDTYKPLRGEVCFCEIPEGNAEATNAPTVLFKVGDGVNVFGQLNWASALAADVYSWAKKNAVKTVGDGNAVTSAEIKDGYLQFNKETVFATKAELDAALEAFGGDLSNITDNDTRYNFSTNGDKLVVTSTVYVNGKEGATTPVGEYEFLTSDEARNIADGLIGKADITIKGEDGLAGEDSFNVNATEAKTIILSHADTSSVANVAKEARKYVAGVTFDDYGHVTAVEMGEEVDQDLTHNHDAQYKKIQTAVGNKVNGLQILTTLTQNENGDIAYDVKDLELSDLGLENALHFIGVVDALPATGNNGDVVLCGGIEYVWANGEWHELGNEGSHALKTVSITGTGYLTGGGDLSADRTIDIAPAVKEKIDKVWQEVGNYKTKQNAYSADGARTKTITNVAQNENGEVTVTYGDIAFPECPEAGGSATIATVTNDVVTLKSGAILTNNASGDHVLANNTSADITLAKIAKTGSIYDVAEAETTDDGVQYFVINCNW